MLYRIGFDIEADANSMDIGASAGVVSASNELIYRSGSSVYLAYSFPNGQFKLLHFQGEASFDHDVDCFGVINVEQQHLGDESAGVSPVLLRSGIVSLSIFGTVNRFGFTTLEINHFLGGENQASGSLLVNNVNTAGVLHGSFICRGRFSETPHPANDIRPFLTSMLSSGSRSFRIRKVIRR